MAHNSYELMISLALDGLLETEEEQELHQHLMACNACADVWRRMLLVDSMMVRPPQAAPPANFAAQVMARVEAYETRQQWQPWLIVVLGIASVIAALSLALPFAFFGLGLQHTLAEWPVVGTLLGYALHVFGLAVNGATLAADALTDWLRYVTGNPVALAVVVGALALASTWIGLLEGLKATRMASAPQQSN